jgi:hypothetical protein
MLENRKQKMNTEEKLALVVDRNCLSATSHTSSSARRDVNRLAVSQTFASTLLAKPTPSILSVKYGVIDIRPKLFSDVEHAI